MCGIAGFYLLPHPSLDLSDELMTARLERMGRAQGHRGPDGAGHYLTPFHPHLPRVGLDSRRLAIVDRAHGQQPVYNEDETVYAVLNGEIYNYRALQAELKALGHRFRTDSDAEVLVHLYEAYGIEGLLSRIVGMFAFALWDEDLTTLFLARDPLGEKPLYYRPHRRTDGEQTHGGVDFASELKGLLTLPETPRELDPVAVGQYLIAEAVPAPRTIYKGIFKLEPGHVLICDARGLRRRLFWKPPEPKAIQAQRAEWIGTHGRTPASLEHYLLNTLEQRLDESVEARLMGEVPVGVLLSGGLDSSLVAASMAQHSLSKPDGWPSFSMGFEERSFDESKPAARVARHLKLDHHPLMLNATALPGWMEDVQGWLDEPLADGSLIPTAALMQAVRKTGVIVALSGDGGDEALGGYPTYLADRVLGGRPALSERFLPSLTRVLEHLPASHENLTWQFKLARTLEGLRFEPNVRHGVWMAGWLPQTLQRALHPSWQERLRTHFHEGGPGSPTDIEKWWMTSPLAPSRIIAKTIEGHAWPERAQLHDLLRYLPDDLLVKTDRASMRFGVEVRAPLLDPGLVTLGLMLPPHLKIRGLKTKVALRLLGKRRLPAEILERPKKGFGMPTAHWLRQMPEALLWDWLTPPRGETPLVRMEVLEQWVIAHRAGKADHRKLLWPVVMFERWRKSPWGPS